MISIVQIKQLREETASAITECQKALEESEGDIKKAKEILKKKGKDLADKKITRRTEEGIVESYIHSNKKIGVIIQLGCESDFVAKSTDFQKLAHELCLQVAAMNPEEGLLDSLEQQLWIKDGTKTIKDLINECVAKFGENIAIRRFIRYEV